MDGGNKTQRHARITGIQHDTMVSKDYQSPTSGEGYQIPARCSNTDQRAGVTMSWRWALRRNISGTKAERGWEINMNCESADIMDQQITNMNTQFAPNWAVVLHLHTSRIWIECHCAKLWDTYIVET